VAASISAAAAAAAATAAAAAAAPASTAAEAVLAEVRELRPPSPLPPPPPAAAAVPSADDVAVMSAPVALADPRVRYNLPLESSQRLSHDTYLMRFALPSPQHRVGLPCGKHVFLFAGEHTLLGACRVIVTFTHLIHFASNRRETPLERGNTLLCLMVGLTLR
jgi:hypothetical protein